MNLECINLPITVLSYKIRKDKEFSVRTVGERVVIIHEQATVNNPSIVWI
ncbi:hypothetical protein ACFO8Q_14845 [Effusibacillus consociatus]|uniref:Uncharacterized protein n=1 Tax=Effusibacillus consociatus TaxID=1117041 RepID=A0ABV9Q335_9BACL